MSRRFLIPCLGLILLLTPATAWAKRMTATAAVGADAVIAWNENAGAAATVACLAPLNDPLHESRIYAAMHVAIHDALNAIDRRSRPYVFDGGPNPRRLSGCRRCCSRT